MKGPNLVPVWEIPEHAEAMWHVLVFQVQARDLGLHAKPQSSKAICCTKQAAGHDVVVSGRAP